MHISFQAENKSTILIHLYSDSPQHYVKALGRVWWSCKAKTLLHCRENPDNSHNEQQSIYILTVMIHQRQFGAQYLEGHLWPREAGSQITNLPDGGGPAYDLSS